MCTLDFSSLLKNCNTSRVKMKSAIFLQMSYRFEWYPIFIHLFEFISIPYENQHQTLNIKKIDRGQIRFRDYWITLLQPKEKVRVTDNFFFFAYWFLKIFRMRRYMTQCTFIDNSRFTTFLKSLRVLKFWHKMAYFDQIMLCAKIYITINFFLFVNLQQIKLFQINQLCPNF